MAARSNIQPDRPAGCNYTQRADNERRAGPQPLSPNSLWVLLMVLPAVTVVHFGIIKREERYLEAKFGDEYREYKTTVRRWV